MTDRVPFRSLTDRQQRLIMDLADCLLLDSPDPLYRHLGASSAVFFDHMKAAMGDRRPVMLSDYWTDLQHIPFVAAFVFDPRWAP